MSGCHHPLDEELELGSLETCPRPSSTLPNLYAHVHTKIGAACLTTEICSKHESPGAQKQSARKSPWPCYTRNLCNTWPPSAVHVWESPGALTVDASCKGGAALLPTLTTRFSWTEARQLGHQERWGTKHPGRLLCSSLQPQGSPTRPWSSGCSGPLTIGVGVPGLLVGHDSGRGIVDLSREGEIQVRGLAWPAPASPWLPGRGGWGLGEGPWGSSKLPCSLAQGPWPRPTGLCFSQSRSNKPSTGPLGKPRPVEKLAVGCQAGSGDVLSSWSCQGPPRWVPKRATP